MLQVRVCVKETDQARGYSDRVLAVFRLDAWLVMKMMMMMMMVMMMMVMVMMMMVLLPLNLAQVVTCCCALQGRAAGREHAGDERLCGDGPVVRVGLGWWWCAMVVRDA